MSWSICELVSTDALKSFLNESLFLRYSSSIQGFALSRIFMMPHHSVSVTNAVAKRLQFNWRYGFWIVLLIIFFAVSVSSVERTSKSFFTSAKYLFKPSLSFSA